MDSEANLPGEITEVVGISGATSVAGQPAQLAAVALGNLIQTTNQAQENAVGNQQSANAIQATVLGKVAGMLTTVGPLEAMSAQQILTGNAVAEELGALKAVVAPWTKGGGVPPVPPRRAGGGTSPSHPITSGTVWVRPEHDVEVRVEPLKSTLR
jgi:hypothetical protein